MSSLQFNYSNTFLAFSHDLCKYFLLLTKGLQRKERKAIFDLKYFSYLILLSAVISFSLYQPNKNAHCEQFLLYGFLSFIVFLELCFGSCSFASLHVSFFLIYSQYCLHCGCFQELTLNMQGGRISQNISGIKNLIFNISFILFSKKKYIQFLKRQQQYYLGDEQSVKKCVCPFDLGLMVSRKEVKVPVFFTDQEMTSLVNAIPPALTGRSSPSLKQTSCSVNILALQWCNYFITTNLCLQKNIEIEIYLCELWLGRKKWPQLYFHKFLPSKRLV